MNTSDNEHQIKSLKDILEKLEKKLEKEEKEKTWKERFQPLLAAIVGGLISLMGTLYLVNSQHKEFKKDFKLAQLENLQGSYEQKKLAIYSLKERYGIEEIIEIEQDGFRSGATIRTLEEIKTTTDKPEEQELINNSLSNVKIVLFIDSDNEYKIYCDETRYTFGTNVDDIVEIIKDFPIRILARKGNVDGVEGTFQFIADKRPHVIVIHANTFDNYGDIESLFAKIYRDIDQEYEPTIILYSRGDFSNPKKHIESLSSKIGYPLQEDVLYPVQMDYPNDCFEPNSKNGKRIARVIRQVLDFDKLYSR